MLLSKLSLILAASQLSLTAIAKTCSPSAAGYEVIDDAPGINDAIKECGNGGTIILSSSDIYTLRTPVDLSPCKSCELQIESLVQAARFQWDYWKRVGVVLSITNTSGVTIRSVTGNGILDGNAIDYYERNFWVPPEWDGPALIRVNNQSSDVTIENLVMKNTMSRFIKIQGNSTGIKIRNLEMSTTNQTLTDIQTTPFGIETGEVDRVLVENISMHFETQTGAGFPNGSSTGVCTAFDVGTFNAHIRNVTCKGAWGGALVQFGSFSPALNSDTVGNILVSNFTFDGAYATGFKDFWYGRPTYARNVTWDGITVKSGKPADVTECYLRRPLQTSYGNLCPREVRTELLDVWFKNFRGHVGTMPTDSHLGNMNNLSHVEAHFENWVDTGSAVLV